MAFFRSLPAIEVAGFTGFKPIRSLFTDPSVIPDVRGVYLVLRLQETAPVFLRTGTGGRLKGKNPNLSLAQLVTNWVGGTIVVYIGKAGGGSTKSTLRSRLKPFLAFGRGKRSPHWGGRLIWQLDDAADLVFCWKPFPDEEPRAVEKELIRRFVEIYGKMPFANLSG